MGYLRLNSFSANGNIIKTNFLTKFQAALVKNAISIVLTRLFYNILKPKMRDVCHLKKRLITDDQTYVIWMTDISGNHKNLKYYLNEKIVIILICTFVLDSKLCKLTVSSSNFLFLFF